MHRQARYANRVYGHARRDAQGRLWLQYWLFYYYNDFQLLGPLLSGGKHEGDWELVQLRLERRRAARAGRLQPAHALPRARPGADVKKAGNAPLVYVARGSHANYFGAGLALDGRVVRPGRRQGPADHAHARGRRGHARPWMLWPGRWGDTKATSSPVDSIEPEQPRPPPALAQPGGARPAHAPAQRARPRRARSRRRASAPAATATASCVAYEAPPEATALVVAAAPGGLRRARGHARLRARRAPRGEVELPASATTTSG